MSILLEEPPTLAVKESWRDPDREFEVVNGIEVELPEMSIIPNAVKANITEALILHCCTKKMGKVYPETKIRLRPPVDSQRIPDVCFVSYKTWPKERGFRKGDAWEVSPDLCVEVQSPYDTARNLDVKTEEYLLAGVKMVWVIKPEIRQVWVHQPGGTILVLRKGEVLSGGDVVPGFELHLDDLFPLEDNS